MPILDSGVRCYRLSPLQREDWGNCVRPCIVCVSVGLVWLVSLVFHYWWEKRRCLCSFDARFLITADRDICFNFVRCKSISPNRLGRTILYKAFVRRRLLMIWYSIMLSAKEAIQPRLAQIQRKIMAKPPRSRRNKQSIPPIMKNKRYKPNKTY